MGYAVSETIVRADQFKPSGKWYQSIALEMGAHWTAPSIPDAIKECLMKQGYGEVKDGWSIVVLEPYHQHSHPIMIKG